MARRLPSNHHHTAYNIAAAYGLLGQPSAAVMWMQKAAEDGFPCYPLFAGDASFARVKDNPAVIRFMTTLQGEWEARRKTLDLR